MTRVLITGATGFIGRALGRALAADGVEVIAAARRDVAPEPGIEFRNLGDLADAGDLAAALAGVDSVVHLAARVHVMRDTADDPAAAYRRVNVDATRRLAAAAARAGVGRFVFLSSVKVNGEATPAKPFDEDDTPAPEDPYGVSKWEAEQALAEIAGAAEMETVILRPPLVYGPGVGANFRSLIRLCDTPLPLPLGGADDNARSMIYLGNLVDAIRCVLTHPRAAGATYLVRDGEDVSTAELIRRIRRVLGRPARLISVPAGMLRLAARLADRPATADRLLLSLAVDDGRIRRETGWRPPFTMDQGLAATAAWYRSRTGTSSNSG